jgi:hypothetical protein
MNARAAGRSSLAEHETTPPGQAPRVYPDRLVRVLAEGLRSIEERRAHAQTESADRAMIVLRTTEERTDEPAPEP